MNRIRLPIRVAILVALCTSANAQVRQEQIDMPAALNMPCTSAPMSSIKEVPAALRRFAKVVCSKFGHFIVPANGWVWKQPAAPAFFRVAAQGDKAAFDAVGHKAHFTNISAKKLASHEAKKARALFEKPNDQADYRSAFNIDNVLALGLKTASGETSTLYFFTPKEHFFLIGYASNGRTLSAYAVTFEMVNAVKRQR